MATNTEKAKISRGLEKMLEREEKKLKRQREVVADTEQACEALRTQIASLLRS